MTSAEMEQRLDLYPEITLCSKAHMQGLASM